MVMEGGGGNGGEGDLKDVCSGGGGGVAGSKTKHNFLFECKWFGDLLYV